MPGTVVPSAGASAVPLCLITVSLSHVDLLPNASFTSIVSLTAFPATGLLFVAALPCWKTTDAGAAGVTC